MSNRNSSAETAADSSTQPIAHSSADIEANPMLVAGRSMQEWILHETRKRETTFWGEKGVIKPVICSEILGDGLQLVYLVTIDQRPNYWLIRIDSKTNISDDDFDFETILEPLEEEFGRVPESGWLDKKEFKTLKSKGELENYDYYKHYNSACQYPAISWGGGHWGMIVNFGTGEVGT